MWTYHDNIIFDIIIETPHAIKIMSTLKVKYNFGPISNINIDYKVCYKFAYSFIHTWCMSYYIFFPWMIQLCRNRFKCRNKTQPNTKWTSLHLHKLPFQLQVFLNQNFTFILHSGLWWMYGSALWPPPYTFCIWKNKCLLFETENATVVYFYSLSNKIYICIFYFVSCK